MGAILAADDFNRTDANPIGGNWATITAEGAMQIVSNAATPANVNNDSGARYTVGTFPPDQYAQCNVTVNGPTLGTGPGPGVRMAAAAETYYRATISNNASNVELTRCVAGVFTTLWARTATFTDGDLVRLEVKGSVLRVLINGVPVGTDFADSAPILTGNPGISFSSGSVISATLDNWSAGDFVDPTVDPYPWPLVWQLLRSRQGFTTDSGGVAPVTVDGTLAVTDTVAGTIGVDPALDGTRPITDTIAGALAITLLADGTRPTTDTITGTLAVTLLASGSLALTDTITGTLSVTRTVDGTRPTTDTITGTLAVDRTVSGSLVVTDTITGTLTVTRVVDGSLPVTATITGAFDVVTPGGAVTVDGTRPTTATIAGTIAATHVMDGTRQVTATIAGTTAVVALMSGNRSVVAIIAGDIVVVGPVVALTQTAITVRLGGDGPISPRIAGDGPVAGRLAGDGPSDSRLTADGPITVRAARISS